MKLAPPDDEDDDDEKAEEFKAQTVTKRTEIPIPGVRLAPPDDEDKDDEWQKNSTSKRRRRCRLLNDRRGERERRRCSRKIDASRGGIPDAKVKIKSRTGTRRVLGPDDAKIGTSTTFTSACRRFRRVQSTRRTTTAMPSRAFLTNG